MMVMPFLVLVLLGNGADANNTSLKQEREQVLRRYPEGVVNFNELWSDIEFSVIAISKVDAASQTFDVGGLFLLEWQDSHLALNSSTVNSTKPYLYYYTKQIFTPIFMIKNSVSGNTFVQWDVHLPIRTAANGRSTVLKSTPIRTRCYVDITYFPFDQQTCEVVLLEYVGHFNLLIKRFFVKENETHHSEWSLLDMKVVTMRNATGDHVIMVKLKRQSLFYIVMIIFPMVLLSSLNSFVFLLPSDSDVKISFLVSLFVTYAVFVNFVNDFIPKTNKLPRIAIYLVLIQCHSTSCILATIFLLNRHHKKNKTTAALKSKENTGINESDVKTSSTGDARSSWKSLHFLSLFSFKSAGRLLFVVFLSIAFLMLLVFI